VCVAFCVFIYFSACVLVVVFALNQHEFSEDNMLMSCRYMMKVSALVIFVLVLCMIKLMLS
jgi:hypothetical protein